MGMTSEQFLKELDSFQDRENGLRNVKRYSLYHTMWYRTDLWTHTRRVAWIVEELIILAKKVFRESFDPEKAIALALVHDDAEMIFGDIQAGNKAKMSEGQFKEVENLERNAIKDLAKKYPAQLGKYNYEELLLEAVDQTSLELMIVSWADKYDAFCEALHEIYAGNKLWTINVKNEYGKIDLPTEYYMKYFNSFDRKFPRSSELFPERSSWFIIPNEPKIFDIVNQNSIHTEESLKTKKDYYPYDQWIALTFNKGTEEDKKNLYINKEN